MLDQSGSVLSRNGLAETKLRMGVTTGIGGEGRVLGEFAPTGNLPSFLDDFIVRGLIKAGEPYL